MQVVTTTGPEAKACAQAGDAELVRRYRLGDTTAFEELYCRHMPLLLRSLTRLVGLGEVAEELAQETFLRAARRLPDDVGDRFRSWLLRVGHNLAMDWLRAARRQRTLHDRVASIAVIGRDQGRLDLDAHEEMRSVVDVLRKLPPRYQEVLVHREVYGLDYTSMAHAMDITTSALQTLLHRARTRFREEYRRTYGAVA